MKTNEQLRQNKIEDRTTLRVIVSGKIADDLKRKALELNTSYAEIIRTLLENYLNNEE